MKTITIQIIILSFVCCSSFIALGQQYNVKDYGAKGDGSSNDYSAIKKVVELININKKGKIYFPPGEYYIGEYHNGQNDIQDFEFKNCDGLKIYGKDAKIILNGKYNRTLSRQGAKHVFSNIAAVLPIKILNCKNVSIENLEINGSVNETTRDKGVVEGNGYLIMISQSDNVYLHNLNLHHAQTDGLLIRGGDQPSTNIRAVNIISSNNARQGMSISSLDSATFDSCKFINTGITGGNYGNHGPSAGVDIEPNSAKQTVQNVHFNNCVFENNLGSQFVCSSPTATKNVYFDNCVLNSGDSSNKYSIIINAVNVVFTNCSFDCKNGSIYPVWHKEGSSTIFKKCIIKSNTSGFVANDDLETNSVVIDSCNLEYTGSKKVNAFFPYLRLKGLTFTNNTIHIPEQYYKDQGFTALIQNAKLVSNNTFSNNERFSQSKISLHGSNLIKR